MERIYKGLWRGHNDGMLYSSEIRLFKSEWDNKDTKKCKYTII
jgi:hypothetical protein